MLEKSIKYTHLSVNYQPLRDVMQGTSLSGQVCFYEGKLVAIKDFPLQVVPDMKMNHYVKPYTCTNTEFDCLEVDIKERW